MHRLSDREAGAWFRACEDRPGVYRLVGLRDGQALDPEPLARVCGEDDLGTLYIGAAARSLQSRLGQLVAQHLPGWKGGGYAPMPAVLACAFPADRLAVCWSYAVDGSNVFAMERAMLTAYTEALGERPPLNTMG